MTVPMTVPMKMGSPTTPNFFWTCSKLKAISLILVPLTLVLALILPGNKVLPFGDLASIPYMFVLILPLCPMVTPRPRALVP